MHEVKVELTDSEWMSIIDMTRDGLPVCCGSISDLRDDVMLLARNGGVLYRGAAEQMIEDYDEAIGSHEGGDPLPVLDNLIGQVRDALTRFPELPQREPVQAGEIVKLPAREHVHDYDSGPLPEPCAVPDCERYPRIVGLWVQDGKSIAGMTASNRSDLIGGDLINVRSTLSMVVPLGPKHVPFHDNMEQAWESADRALSMLHGDLWPEDKPAGAFPYDDAAERGLLVAVLRSAIRIERKKLAALIEVHGEAINRTVAEHKAAKVRILEGVYRKLGGDPEQISNRAALPAEWS